MKNRKEAQSTIEYILLLTAVVALLIVFLSPTGNFRNMIADGVTNSIQQIQDMTDSTDFLAYTPPGGGGGCIATVCDTASVPCGDPCYDDCGDYCGVGTNGCGGGGEDCGDDKCIPPENYDNCPDDCPSSAVCSEQTSQGRDICIAQGCMWVLEYACPYCGQSGEYCSLDISYCDTKNPGQCASFNASADECCKQDSLCQSYGDPCDSAGCVSTGCDPMSATCGDAYYDNCGDYCGVGESCPPAPTPGCTMECTTAGCVEDCGGAPNCSGYLTPSACNANSDCKWINLLSWNPATNSCVQGTNYCSSSNSCPNGYHPGGILNPCICAGINPGCCSGGGWTNQCLACTQN